MLLLGAARGAAQTPDEDAGAVVVPLPSAESLRLPARAWVRGEYLLWWLKNEPVPVPLITTGSPADARPGAVGMPATSIVFADTELDYRSNSGARLVLGRWLGESEVVGVEAAGFVLESHTIHGKDDSDGGGSPSIARPFQNALTGLPDAQVITSPGVAFGGIDVFADSRLWGGEASVVRNLRRGESATLDLVGGFRYLALKNELTIRQSSTLLAPDFLGFAGAPAPPPDIVSLRDNFHTLNQFYGAQLGLRGTLERGRWSANAAFKAGLGSTHQQLDVSGITMLTDSTGATRAAAGGLFALPSNSGTFARDPLTFISELDIGLGCQITPRLSATVGYTFLYWGNVARPGDNINAHVDPRQVSSSLAFGTPAAPAQPVHLFQSDDFWAQGLSVGLLLEF